ncbi:universal stress protein [Natronococcus wangiae]|uniref:universal stress protein n=1 Tax=Natronococcus wangiae TaxID=3068275 RepID=UPI00273D3CA8|nr:universal stress protein [Natronococcus sp. AD5]
MTHRFIRRGIPATEILEHIDEHDVDLVVLGARGRSAFKTILLGSTSEAIVRDASIPVVLLLASGEDRTD